MITELKSKCVVCKRNLVCITTSEYRGDPMHLILGPGSRNQMTRTSRIQCDHCGLSYYKEPSE